MGFTSIVLLHTSRITPLSLIVTLYIICPQGKSGSMLVQLQLSPIMGTGAVIIDSVGFMGQVLNSTRQGI